MNDITTNSDENEMNKKAKCISYTILGVLLGFGITMMILFIIYQDKALELIVVYQEFIQKNIFKSLIILIITYIIASILFLPGAIFCILTGIIFATIFKGKIIGYIISLVAFLTIQAISGLVVFNISKFLIKDKIRKYFIEENDNLKKLDKLLMFYGTKALFLFRLSPLVPITLFNYVAGGFNITNMTFFLSAFGSFPSELLPCYIGYSAVNIGSMINQSQKNFAVILMTVLGGIILIILIFVFGKISQNQFNNLVEENEKKLPLDLEMNKKSEIY